MAYSASPIASVVVGLGQNGGTTSGVDTSGSDILFAVVTSYAGVAAPTVSDSESNTWTGLTERLFSANLRVQIFYAVATSVGAAHTFTVSGADSYSAIGVAAFSGGKSSSPFDIESGYDELYSGYDMTPGSVTPTEDDEIVITGMSGNDHVPGLAISGGFSIIGSAAQVGGVNVGIAMGFLVQTSAGAANPTWSWTNPSQRAGANATFKAQGAAPSGASKFVVMNGKFVVMNGKFLVRVV